MEIEWKVLEMVKVIQQIVAFITGGEEEDEGGDREEEGRGCREEEADAE